MFKWHSSSKKRKALPGWPSSWKRPKQMRVTKPRKTTVTFRHGYYPMWRHGGFCFHENGGRKIGECLDMTVVIGRHDFGMTVWGLPFRIPLPRAKNRRGFCIGWLPLGGAA